MAKTAKTTEGSGGAAAAKKKTSVKELTEQYGAKAKVVTSDKTETATAEQEFANIEANTFFKIMFDESTSPTEKKGLVAKALAFTDSKEEARVALEEFEQFKAYLQAQRKDMARQIIKLTDTETFSELQSVYGEINDSLMEFEATMGPLTDIIDAVYTLRNSGVTLDIYAEIKQDKEAEEAMAIERARQESELEALRDDIGNIRRTNATLRNDKSWGGFGGTKRSALDKIAVNEVTLSEKQAEVDALVAEIESGQKAPETQFAQFAEEKAKLRELLDITSDEHKARQDLMVTKAIEFVDTTEERVGQVLTHFDGMNDQIARLGDANFQMRSVYAVLNDATDDAHELTESRRTEIETDLEGKGEIEKLDAAEKLRNLENHVTALAKSDVDTTVVLGELTQAGSRISAMKENNDQQVANTRKLHTSGVAGVADQLSTVLQAVSSAALGEASEAAKMSIVRMHNTTGEIAAKEAFRTALGVQGVNRELETALEDLAGFGDVVTATANIRREAMGENRELLDKLQRQAEEVQESISEANAIAADVVAGKGGVRPAANDDEPQAPTVKNPFGLRQG
ncbi:MAG: hypothetical protein AAF984_09385 [Verrucomicrobiota bacterium]